LYLLTAPVRLETGRVTPQQMVQFLAQAKQSFDYVLMDSPAGIGSGFQLAVAGADRALVVTTSDPSALRDAQRAVTEVSRTLSTIHLVMNRVQPKVMRRLHTTIDDAMDAAGLPLLGVVPEDPQVSLALGSGKPLVLASRRGAAVACLNIAKRLEGQRVSLMNIR
jgi:septum site-determining protein MinD